MSNKTEILFLIDSEVLVDIRLDKVISGVPQIGTRSRGEFLISEGHVTVNGTVKKSSYKTVLNDQISIVIPAPEATELSPLNSSLDIVFEDEHLIVINKPAGLVVHPAAGHANDTLVNILLHHRPEISVGLDAVRPGIVHRIDKETSGLLVIAKNSECQSSLMNQFRSRTTHRIYFALAARTFKEKSGRLESTLIRHPKDRKKFASVEKFKTATESGRWAATNYETQGELPNELSYLKLKLETGRTHQIRVHLSESGHPLVGDLLYGFNPKTIKLTTNLAKQTVAACNRVMLHAAELGFSHPATKKDLKFSVPWPEPEYSILITAGLIK